MSEEKVLQIFDLVEMGGKFYSIEEEAWCDTPLDSYKFVPEKGGFVRVDNQCDRT